MSNSVTKRFFLNSITFLAPALFVLGCSSPGSKTADRAAAPVLQVRWQRLVDDKGQTCGRCGSTEKETENAVKELRRSLKPIHVEVVLQKTSISLQEFSKDPLASNQILIGGKPIEEWLQAKVGQSPCCGACGDSECRTLTVDGKTYESIPTELIVRAGLLAGAQLNQTGPQNPWNSMAGWSPDSSCCPPAQAEKK